MQSKPRSLRRPGAALHALALLLWGCPEGEGQPDPPPPPLPECPGLFVTVTSQAQLNSLASCTELNGIVLIGQNVTSLAPLEGVVAQDGAGRLDLIDTRIADFSPLSSYLVDELTMTDNAQLETLLGLNLSARMTAMFFFGPQQPANLDVLGAIEHVDNLVLRDAPAAITASLTALTSAGTVRVERGFAETLTLPSLTSADLIELTALAGNAIALPALEEATRISVTSSETVAAVSLPSLTTVDTLTLDSVPLATLDISSLSTAVALVVQRTELDVVDAPALGPIVDVVDLSGNPALVSFDFPQLTTITGTLQIAANASLPPADVAAFLSSVTVDGTAKIGRNGSADEPPLDPCPWPGDGACDEVFLCLQGTDVDDCTDAGGGQ